jgi:hypothetical protein
MPSEVVSISQDKQSMICVIFHVRYDELLFIFGLNVQNYGLVCWLGN